MRGVFRLLVCAVPAVLLAACAPVPLDAPGPVTLSGIAAASAPLWREAARLVADGDPDDSALIPLVEGNEALGARLRLIERAEHSTS